MASWDWKRKSADPEAILDAASTIKGNSQLLAMNLTARWVDARDYLKWALSALQRGGNDGYDSAASWAKRAVCRQMDGLLMQNNLCCFMNRNYKDKAGYLAKLNIPGLGTLRQLVIDPRNDIEHEYELAGKDQSHQAYDIAELFLDATNKQATQHAIITFGWNVDCRYQACSTPGKEYERIEYKLTKEHSPMLVIDYSLPAPLVTVIHPKDEELITCELKLFSAEQVIELNNRMTEPVKGGNYVRTEVDPNRLGLIKFQLGMH